MGPEPNFTLIYFVIGYLVFMIGLGIYFTKKVKNSDDFVLAGRSLGPIVLTGTLIATWFGSGTITGSGSSVPAMYGIWNGISGIAFTFIAILLLIWVSAKVRAAGKYTVSELLAEKYGPVAKDIAAVIILLAYVGISSYQFRGIAFVLKVATGLDIEIGTLIGLFIMVFLAVTGGLKSVAVSDAISAFMIMIALTVAVPVSINTAGGWSEVVRLQEIQNAAKLAFPMGTQTFIGYLGLKLPAVFLMLGDQNMYQRMAASDGEKTTKKSLKGMLIGTCFITPPVAIIAFVTNSMYPNMDPGMAFIAAAAALPTFFGGLLLASCTAFIVTTGNSFLLSSATNVTYDFYIKYINKTASDKKKLMVTRITIPILAIIAYVMLTFFPSILAVQMYSYTVYGAGLTPAIFGALLWKRVTKWGGLASMLLGAGSTLLWELLLSKPVEEALGFSIASVLIAIPLSIIALVVVSLLTQKSEDMATSN